ncbi:MAG: hypothetical protein H7070_14705 [Saprospiraceae bacterium]|nr:hypothetical protein [Pyrinomonadaceae bacterium]
MKVVPANLNNAAKDGLYEMRKRRSPIRMFHVEMMCTTLLLLLSTLTVRADLKIVSNVKKVGPSLSGDKKESSTMTTYTKGNRTRAEMSDGVILIYDHSADLLYRIDPKKKTYTVMNLKPMFNGPSPNAPGPKLIAKIEAKQGSGAKTIAGRAANSYAVTGFFTTEMEGVPSSNMLSYTMEAEFWLADGPKPMLPNSDLLAAVWYVHEGHIVPQQANSSASAKAMRAQGINVDTFQQSLVRNSETAWYPSLKPMLDKIAPFPGALLASKTTMRLAKSPMGATGVLIEATSVSEEVLDEALFNPPADYTQTGGVTPTPTKTVGTTAPDADPNNYAAFAGVYAAPFGELTITREGDRLFGEGTRQPKEELTPQTGNSFLIKKFGINITFFKDEKGHVTHFVLVMNGQQIQAKKIR